MQWEIVIQPRAKEWDLDGQKLQPLWSKVAGAVAGAIRSARVLLIAGDWAQTDIERLARQLLVDDPVEKLLIQANEPNAPSLPRTALTILPKPGVMDPVAETIQQLLQSSQPGAKPLRLRTGRRFLFPDGSSQAVLERFAWDQLANDAIEEIHWGPLPDSAWAPVGSKYAFARIEVPLRDADDVALMTISRQGQLSLTLEEMTTIQTHFRSLGREPTDVELETIAQTWSEHCSHKTLKGRIEYTGPDGKKLYQNLLKETIFQATQQLRQQWGADDWCVSVFADNAGVVQFDDDTHVCFKVETHNHPSAIEPYGGANTGIGGVIRDILGTGLGAKPIANTDVFCFAAPQAASEPLPPGVLAPERVIRGVVCGVRDYGNRMGIPTVNGAVCFDDRYLANPLVYCGSVGLLPKGLDKKHARPGDLIVALGGRTGRDGIHGATFSSAELSEDSEQVSGGAVQIGNAITEKKLLDVLLQARDQGLYHAVTDCGAGGFSSAVGEMGAELGAEVDLEKAPLKYEGLSYTEIWISEAQERMVLAVPPAHWPALQQLCQSEDVEATVLGRFAEHGRLVLRYRSQLVADLQMHFLHEGRPPVIRQATWQPPVSATPAPARTTPSARPGNGEAQAALQKMLTRPAPAPPPSTPLPTFNEDLLDLLAAPNIHSKEWIVRQYDHEVQGRTVIKPLVGKHHDGPGNAAVLTPKLGTMRGIALGCGINPSFGDHDPYWMAASVIDEAIRNVVAVGANPSRVAILDNFCWGNTDRPEQLGSLVRAAEGCRDAALAFGTPFISGKDSLNNEYRSGNILITIPPTLLISALGLVPDVTQCVTMDLKKPGQHLYLLGTTQDELAGSQWQRLKQRTAGHVPKVDFAVAPKLFARLHQAIRNGYLASCHDLSEGGLAVALAEMCLAGELGAVIDISQIIDDGQLSSEAILFSESNSRFLIEVPFEWDRVCTQLFEGLPIIRLGKVTDTPRLSIFGSQHGGLLVDLPISELKKAWKTPLV